MQTQTRTSTWSPLKRRARATGGRSRESRRSSAVSRSCSRWCPSQSSRVQTERPDGQAGGAAAVPARCGEAARAPALGSLPLSAMAAGAAGGRARRGNERHRHRESDRGTGGEGTRQLHQAASACHRVAAEAAAAVVVAAATEAAAAAVAAAVAMRTSAVMAGRPLEARTRPAADVCCVAVAAAAAMVVARASCR